MKSIMTVVHYIPNNEHNKHVIRQNMLSRNFERRIAQIKEMYPNVEFVRQYSVLPGNEYKNIERTFKGLDGCGTMKIVTY